jgi:formate dehydrogenase subunit gamma
MKTEVERYTFHERLCHWINSFTYVYCLCTGLAFYSPYLFWMAIALGGGPTSRFWHPILGLGFFGCTLWMHSLWRRDLNITAADRLWMKEVKHYIKNEDDQVPPAGRFNAGQKHFYWIMFYGAIGLLLSGVAMWFPETIPVSLSWVRPIMVVIHEGSALITIGAFIIHVYMGVFMVPGGMRGMVIGRVPDSWAKAHHALWYKSLSEK